ncbi:MAG: dTMP kinase [Chitinivibrionales bacterium]
MSGLFITFEGIDGCGKTTQLKLAQEYLRSKELPLIVTREPGGTPIAEKIREIIISPHHSEMTDACELLLYLAARAQHVGERIVPALKDGKVVLCDRFQEATFAYQGYGRGYDLSVLREMNRFATDDIHPAQTFIFDLPVEDAFERMKKMNKAPDRLEQNSAAFYQKIRSGYLELARNESHRVCVLDATQPVEQIAALVEDRIDELLREKKL